jgi:ABC-2 type transport system permease protein
MIGHVPVGLLRRFDPLAFLGVVAFAVLSVSISAAVFQVGLRRYESGNLVGLRG